MSKIITYGAPNGSSIDVCAECAKTDIPRNRMGQQYASVTRGAHEGGCQICGVGYPAWHPLAALSGTRNPALSTDDQWQVIYAHGQGSYGARYYTSESEARRVYALDSATDGAIEVRAIAGGAK